MGKSVLYQVKQLNHILLK